MSKRDIITIVILVLIFGLFFTILLLNKEDKESIKEQTEYNELTRVIDESIFLSIENNINKIYEYANTNSEGLSFVLNDEIDENILKNKSFKAEQVYVISRLNLYKYYIKGSTYIEMVDTEPKFIAKEYFILNYDIENSAYNVELIDDSTYENAKDAEQVFESIGLNDYNRFEYVNLSPKSRAVIYFNHFLDKMYNEPDYAYSLISLNSKQLYFNNYENFEQFVINHSDISLEQYSVNDNEIAIKDNNNIEYIFNITSVFNYSVTINMTEE